MKTEIKIFFMTTIQVRVDENTKKNAQAILNKLGFDLSSAIKIYLRQVVQKKGIPFVLITKNGFTTSQEEKLIKESNKTIKLFKSGKLKQYRSAKSLIADLI
jgi:DNA-damage-inducible protein J